MSVPYFTLQAVVLETSPFKEYDRIITLFSEQGLVKLFVKVSKRDFLLQNALTSPLVLGEYVCIQGRGNLLQFRDGTILCHHMSIRDHFEKYEIAQKMMQIILRSQWQGKPAPQLYTLFQVFLEKISTITPTNSLLSAFILKTLKHEGILQLDSNCATCQERIVGGKRFKGERYCIKHAPPDSLSFSAEEEREIERLSESRSWEKVLLPLSSCSFSEKIETLFNQLFT